MEDQREVELKEIIAKLKQQFIKNYFLFQEEDTTAIDTTKKQTISSFLTNAQKVLLALSKNYDLNLAYFRYLANELWKQEPSENIIPLYIELPQLKNVFTDLIEEGLSFYGLNKEQQETLFKSKAAFVLILIGYDQLKTERPRNLYVTNRLEKFNIKKVIVTCHSDYSETQKNYRLFFANYQNKEPQYEKLQEINLDKVELTSLLPQTEMQGIKPVDDSYWNRILTDDLIQLFSDSSITGYKQPPTLEELQIHPLNIRSLVEIPTELNTRAESVMKADDHQNENENFKFKQLCFLFVRYSKYSPLVEVGAANTITILNAAGISFSGMDMSDIRIRGANLNGAILDSTKLVKASLEKVNLQDAWLQETDFSFSDMKNVYFGEKPYIELPDAVMTCSYSVDGKKIVATAGKNLYIYDLNTHIQPYILIGHTKLISAMVLSNSGQWVITGSYDQTIRLWSMTSKSCKSILRANEKISCLILSKNEKEILWSGEKGNIFRIEIETGKLIQNIKEHTKKLSTLSLSYDGEYFVSGGGDKLACVWLAKTDQSIYKLKTDSTINCSAFNGSSNLVAVGCDSGDVFIWSLEKGDLIYKLCDKEGPVTSLTFSYHNKWIIAGGGIVDRNIHVWSVETGKLIYVFEGHVNSIRSVKVSVDENYILSGSEDRTIHQWNLSLKSLYSRNYNKTAHTAWITSIAIDKGGKLVVSGSLDNTLRLWDAKTGKCIRQWKRTETHINCLAFDPFGQWIVAGYYNGCIKIFSIIKNEERILKEHDPTKLIDDNTEEIICIAVSPDGRYIAAGGADKKLHLWIGRTDHIMKTFEENSLVASVAFDPNCQYLASGYADKSIKLRSLETGEISHIFKGERSRVESICFSYDSKYLISGAGNIISLWLLESGMSEFVWIMGDKGKCDVKSIAFSHDDKWIIVGSWHESIRLIDVETRKIVDGLFVGNINCVGWINNMEGFFITGGTDKTIKCWQIIDTDKGPQMVLRWNAGKTELAARNTCLNDVIGLEQSGYDLLIQHGALVPIGRNSSTINELLSKNMSLLMIFCDRNYKEISLCFFTFLSLQGRQALKNTSKALMELVEYIVWEDKKMTSDLQAIVNEIRDQIFIYHLVLDESSKICITEKQAKLIEDFLINDKKVLLTLSKDQDMMSFYFSQVAKKLWQHKSINSPIPLYIELARLKDPFTHLIEEGLSIYGLSEEQQKILLKRNSSFILILIGYEQLKSDRSRNLFVTNKLDKFNVQKIIITCNSEYIETKRNYSLFFVSYKNKEPQYDKFQEINLDKIELASSLDPIESTKVIFVKHEYWHKILTDNLDQLLSDPKVNGYKQPPTLKELQLHPLNKRLIIEDIDELAIRADAIKHNNSNDGWSDNFKFKQLCFLFLRYSKQSRLLQIAAANAITILNHARVPFSDMNLSHVKIPKANLNNAVLHNTDLSYTDLNFVTLENAYFVDADLRYSQMEGIKFGQYPALLHKDQVLKIIFSSDGRWLITMTNNYIYIWDVYLGEPVQILLGNEKKITDLHLSLDNRFLASGGSDKLIRVWEVVNGWKLLYTFSDHKEGILTIRFSLDSKLLVSGSMDKTIKVWDMILGGLRYTLDDHKGTIDIVRFNPKSNILACSYSCYFADASWYSETKLYDVETKNIISKLENLKIKRFSSDGKTLALTYDASGKEDTSIKLFDTETKKIISLIGHEDSVTVIRFSPNGKILASASGKIIKLWDVDSGQVYATLIGHGRIITRLHFTSDSEIIASASYDNTVRIWDVSKGQIIRVVSEHLAAVSTVRFSPLSKLLASSSDNIVRLIDTINKEKVPFIFQGHTNSVTSLLISSNPKLLASGSRDGTVKLWNMVTGQLIQTLKEHKSYVICLCFNEDGSLLASGSLDKTVKLWDIQTMKVRFTLEDHKYGVTTICFHPHEKILASGSNDGAIRIWDVISGQARHIINGHKHEVTYLQFSPNGKILASCSRDKSIGLWDITSGHLYSRFEGHISAVSISCFNLAGTLLASGSPDRTIRLWDVLNMKLSCELIGHESAVTSLQFSNDGMVLASGEVDGILKLWDVKTFQARFTLIGHKAEITGIRFSPDSKILFSSSMDGKVGIWEISTGRKLNMLLNYGGGIRCFDFSPKENNIIVTGNEDGRIQCWHTAAEETTYELWRLQWRSHTSLECKDARIQGVKSLSFFNQRLLIQHRALDDLARSGEHSPTSSSDINTHIL